MDVWGPKPFGSYGTYGGFFPLMTLAWTGATYLLAVNTHQAPLNVHMPKAEYTYTGLRCKHNLLNQHPIDLLAVEAGGRSIIREPNKPEHWEIMVATTRLPCRPKFVIESWEARAVTWEHGPVGKAARTRWQDLGYSTRLQRVDSQDVGGAIIQPRLMVLRIVPHCSWKWSPINTSNQKRPMSNLLTPPGLIRRRTSHSPPQGAGRVYESTTEPMPSAIGRWIKTEKGIRRLLPEEVGRGLGIPKHWEVAPTLLNARNLNSSTSTYHWEYMGQCFSATTTGPEGNQASEENPDHGHTPSKADKDGGELLEDVTWRPPNLTKNGPWYQARVARLKACALQYPNYHQIVAEGLEDLERHRSNFDHEGPNPTTLQLLWWEFPIEHHEDLRRGASMNFLKVPEPGLTDNSDMTDEQLVVAGEFVDELISLGVLQLPPTHRATLLNAPLFVIPKPGQPGQWRCIADMLRGGQNMCIGTDPTILPRANDILQELYHGGFSAVVDMSKYFYQFRTREEERKWLGTIHPISGIIYEYAGLPMGSGNSPAIACRIGQGFLRMLRAKYSVFQGEGEPNCYWTSFSGLGYDPRKGYGFTMTNKDGLVAKVWGFVDDFLIHGPTKEITTRALHAFLDLACTVGFLCHPKKCTAPCQVVKYIGFTFDTINTPILRIPTDKRERALNIARHLVHSPTNQRFSRLGLAVAVGILQSLVDATPAFLGNTYLRQSHSLVHPPGQGTGILPYFTYTLIPRPVRDELQWWCKYLEHNNGRAAYTQRASTLIPTWGDGSGTGTGGTLALPDKPLQMWQGQWTPVVYKFSSNTKELGTLLLTMQHLQKANSPALRGSTVFYFTDNSTTYYIAQSSSSRSPHLHRLIEQIRLIELDLECHLRVVHVPGTVMIQQGTDNLSRGIWCSPFHARVDQQALTATVFAPLTPDLGLLAHIVTQYELSPHWEICDWNHPWADYNIFNKLTVWFPPPEFARPLILHILFTWSEQPWTSSALFFVPRVLAGFWQGLSRHVIELCIIPPDSYPLFRPPTLPIPIVVLYVAPHVRTLPTRDRLDRAPMPRQGKPHQQAAEEMRRLSPPH